MTNENSSVEEEFAAVGTGTHGYIGSWIMGLLTSKVFIFYCLLNYGWVIYAYTKTIKSFGRKTPSDVERDEKYRAFKRNDIEKLQANWLFTLVQSPTLIFRALFGYLPWGSMLVLAYLTAGLDAEGTPMEKRVSYKMMRIAQMIIARLDLLLVGCWPGLLTIEEVEVDYKKYLGPDWKLDKTKGPTAVVANHQSFLDIVTSMYLRNPSVIAKQGIYDIPLVGKCAEAFGCLFLQREDKSSQRSVISQIIERQCQVEKGMFTPLQLYPEGGTTNGKQLISFKKGAFVGLKSVKPVVFKYESPGVEVEHCIISLYDFIPFVTTNLWLQVTVKQLPVFEPNEYFFNHHSKPNEEKWETFARVIRTIMADNSHLTLSDFSVEDKYAYKKLLFPKRKASE